MDSKISAITWFMDKGGIAIWVIAALGALTAGLIVWKVICLGLMGAWAPGQAERAVTAWLGQNPGGARNGLGRARGVYDRPVATTLEALSDGAMSDDARREDVARVATKELSSMRAGLRALELIATIAPLVGLLGTVLGMVAAFQALEAAGNRADPSALAGGIWEALLTTAAGMAVAIPASAALTWFESVADRAQLRIEDMVTRLFVAPVVRTPLHAAAE